MGILFRKFAVDDFPSIIQENEKLPLTLLKTKFEPLIVSHNLWMPYESYTKMRDFIYAREMEILRDEEELGPLFSLLQWVNYMENELQDEKNA